MMIELWEPDPRDEEGNDYYHANNLVHKLRSPYLSPDKVLLEIDHLRNLNGTVFVFYSKSADKYPGKGTGETIPEHLLELYKPLSLISNWRKMLSNFYIAPFQLDGRTWASVEHYYQASKFKKENPQFYSLFSLESGSELSKDPVLAKSAGGKTGKINKKAFRPMNVQIDKDFFTTDRHMREMNRAQEAKFQIPELKRVLFLTKGADLQHYLGRGKGLTRFDFLMKFRDNI